MFENTFWTIVKPSTLGPCWGGYFHFIPNKTQKYIGFNLLDFFFQIIYAYWVSIIQYQNFKIIIS